ncbi:ATP-binding cassette domain-containing protein [Eisenbergiella sp.]
MLAFKSSHLQNGTIRENLTLGRNISDTECWTALQSACMEEEVKEWPGGLDTLTGENGIMLSGGQKQRLLLAHMLLEHPSLYLLDDATSALDRVTAEKLLLNLKQRMMQDKAAAVFISNSEVVKVAADRELYINQGT